MKLLGQLALFEDLLDEKDAAPEPKKRVVEGHERRAPVRRALPEDLEEREIHHDLDEAGQVLLLLRYRANPHRCDYIEESRLHSGPVWKLRSTFSTNTPARFATAWTTRGSRLYPNQCPRSTLAQNIRRAATLLAFIIISKYEDALPLYRLEKSLARLNIDLSRKTMTHWVLKLSEALSQLHELMLEKVKEAPWLGIGRNANGIDAP